MPLPSDPTSVFLTLAPRAVNGFAVTGGILLIITTLWDAFETIVLPRPVTRQQLTRRYYTVAGKLWSSALRKTALRGHTRTREAMLVAFGPLSLITLIVVWASGLIWGFALLQWGMGASFTVPDNQRTLGTSVYNSGATFLTLGYGDVSPVGRAARFVAITEAGVGFGFLALVISYLPVLSQSFSRREVAVALVNSRAGNPPHAGNILRRYGQEENRAVLEQIFRDAEAWAAEMREAYTSYPVLAYYRCQREGDSWLSSLTAVLDAAALVESCFAEGPPWQQALAHQARLTGEMGEQVLVSLSRALRITRTDPSAPPRLTQERWLYFHANLIQHGVLLPPPDDSKVRARFDVARARYEPYVVGLARSLHIPIDEWWMPSEATVKALSGS